MKTDVTRRRFHLSSRDRTSDKSRDEAEQTTSTEESSEEEREMSEEEIKLYVLSSSLDFVKEHGWSTQALAAGAEAEGLPGVAHGMFPRGGVELVEFFYKDCNGKLADHLYDESERLKNEGEKMVVTKFIRDAVEFRLRMIHPYMDTWSEAMGLQALPMNAPQSWQNLLNLVDDIWFYAGDTSTDMNWYTKRFSLAYVYKGTEIYMLQDNSDDFTNTWTFLDNRLRDIKTVGKAFSQGQDILGSTFNLIKAAASVGTNVSGMNKHVRRTR